ncbi:MAG: helix-turn-helix domain containing protein [Microbacterium arborescens]
MTTSVRPVRPTSAEIDEAILDAAAALVARRGARDTSVQAVADATGLSKTGLLRRFPSKDTLIDAALEQCVRLTRDAHDRVAAIDDDIERDAATIRALTDLALRHPGWAQIVLASIPPIRDERLRPGLAQMGDVVSGMFRIDDATGLARRARVTGALGVLVTLALTYESQTTAETARPLIEQVCRSTLGYRGDT